MNKKILLLFILILCVTISIDAKTRSDFVPRIDRSLQDTKGTRNLSIGAACEKQLHSDTLTLRFSANYSYAVTDKVTFSSLPWPIIQMKVKSTDSSASLINGFWEATALSLCFGVTGTAPRSHFLIHPYSPYGHDYFRIFPQVELLSKTRLQKHLWFQYNMKISTISDEAFQGYLYPRVGYQITDHIYSLVGCRAGFFNFSSFNAATSSRITYFYRYGYSLDFYHSSNANSFYVKRYTRSVAFPIEIGFDPGKHFSAVVSTSIGKRISRFIPLQLRCNLEW